jgi:hypothetical protein
VNVEVGLLPCGPASSESNRPGLPARADFNQLPVGQPGASPPFPPLYAGLVSMENLGFANYQGLRTELTLPVGTEAYRARGESHAALGIRLAGWSHRQQESELALGAFSFA